MAENTNLLRKKIAQRTGKHIITVGRETTLPTAVISSDGSQKDRFSTENREQKNTPQRIRRIETESDKSSEDEEVIRKMTDKIRIHKIKIIKQKYYNTIEVRIGDIDAYCDPDSGTSANIMDEYQFKALKRRTNISELKPNYD